METPEFRLIPDTNILRTRDEKLAFFSGDFLGAMKPRVGATKRAFICEITAEEIAYQKTGIAQSNLEKVAGAAKSLHALTGQTIAVQDFGELRKHVQSRLGEEMKKAGFEFLATPVGEINWATVVDDAVWRRPPFEGTAESKNEKGFRDAVFVETVLSSVRKEPNANWCVLTNDGLVYQRLDAEAKSLKSLSLFRTTDEFLGYVELRVQKFEEALAANLQVKAHVAFYDPATKTGIFNTAEVEKRVREKHGLLLEAVPTLKVPDGMKAGFTQLLKPSFEFWQRESGDQIFLEGTRFSKRESKTRIQWITRIRMCAVFRGIGIGNQPIYPPSIIRDTRFDIFWSADVSASGDVFSNAAIGEVALVRNERTTDSAFTRMQLGLPIPESSVFYNNTSTPNLSTNVAVPSGVAPLFFNQRPPTGGV